MHKYRQKPAIKQALLPSGSRSACVLDPDSRPGTGGIVSESLTIRSTTLPEFVRYSVKMIKMHQITLFITLLSLSLVQLSAQSPAPAEKSDPEAKKILDKVKSKYNGYKSLEAVFTLTIQVPETPKEVQKGTIAQSGKQFRLDMTDQLIVSNAITTWVYLKKNKEIQINDADSSDDNGFLTPQQLLGRYEKGDFVYAITERGVQGGKSLVYIEFKPVDRRSEYSKLKLAIDEKALTVESIKAFAKDGSNYTFAISSFTPNKAFPAGYFALDPKQFPGVRVEDLRM